MIPYIMLMRHRNIRVQLFIADDRPVDRIYDVADDNNIVQAAALESAYIPSGILTDSYPSIRNQSPYGTCWGFAPTSLAETQCIE